MKSIFDLVKANEIAVYFDESTRDRVPYLGETLFPRKKQLGLELSWIKGAKGIPVVLKASAFDTKADLRDRIGFQQVQSDMPYFKEGMLVKEKDRQELNKVLGSGKSEYVNLILGNIYDDVTNLIDGALAQEERLKMQLLSTGKIIGTTGSVAYDYDYGMKPEQKETLKTTNKWDNSASNPIDDMQRWQQSIEDIRGVKPSKAICTRKTFNYILNNEKIRLDMNPLGGQNVIMTDAMLNQYLESKLGLKIAVYNKKYVDENGETKQFFPDNVFTLIPDKILGNLHQGTSPEESDLMSSNVANVSIVNGGMAITTTQETDPVNVFTKVSMVCLPSFEAIDEVFIATVA